MYQKCQAFRVTGNRSFEASWRSLQTPPGCFKTPVTCYLHSIYSLRNYCLVDLAAFFSFCISFFCLFDLGGAFCTFFCSLFANVETSFEHIDRIDQPLYWYCTKIAQEEVVRSPSLNILLILSQRLLLKCSQRVSNHAYDISKVHGLA